MFRLAAQLGERAGTGHEKALVSVLWQPQLAGHWVSVRTQYVGYIGLSLPSSLGRVPLNWLW